MLTQDISSALDFGNSQLPMLQIFSKCFESTPIETFCYIRWYTSGKLLYLSNNSVWLKTYLTNRYFNVAEHMNCYTANDKSGFFTWFNYKADIVFEHAAHVGINGGINFCRLQKNYAETFIFGASDNINHFVDFFCREQAVIKNIANNFSRNFVKHNDTRDNPLIQSSRAIQEKIHHYYNHARLVDKQKIYLADNIYIGKKAFMCLYWTCQGKTADEVALILNVSRRTVEDHFNLMKTKFNCVNKYQLVHKLHLLAPQLMASLDENASFLVE